MPIRGLIFDLDGTLADSDLDFEQMRGEMGLPHKAPILEAMANLTASERARCDEILARHEERGAERAVLMPGVREVLASIDELGFRRAVFTRNSRQVTARTLTRLGLDFEIVMCREDGPVKPDPAAIHAICALWGMHPSAVAVVGDYRFDLEAGRRAGARAVLYLGGRTTAELDYSHLADYVLQSFEDPSSWLEWLRSCATA